MGTYHFDVSGVSNRQNVRNALTSICLAGPANDVRRNEALLGKPFSLLFSFKKLNACQSSSWRSPCEPLRYSSGNIKQPPHFYKQSAKSTVTTIKNTIEPQEVNKSNFKRLSRFRIKFFICSLNDLCPRSLRLFPIRNTPRKSVSQFDIPSPRDIFAGRRPESILPRFILLRWWKARARSRKRPRDGEPSSFGKAI